MRVTTLALLCMSCVTRTGVVRTETLPHRSGEYLLLYTSPNCPFSPTLRETTKQALRRHKKLPPIFELSADQPGAVAPFDRVPWLGLYRDGKLVDRKSGAALYVPPSHPEMQKAIAETGIQPFSEQTIRKRNLDNTEDFLARNGLIRSVFRKPPPQPKNETAAIPAGDGGASGAAGSTVSTSSVSPSP
jgi:hypothetical protein